MFSGEAEIQARRRTLAVLQDEIRTVLDAARDMSQAYDFLIQDDREGLKASIEKIRKSEDDAESLRRTLTRELGEIGNMLMNREDLLRTSYDIEEIAGYISGTAFRFNQISSKILKKAGIGKDCKEIIDLSIESVNQLNRIVHTLSINPLKALEMAQEVQKLERTVDHKYRNLIVKIFKEVSSIKDLIVLKDIVEEIEDLADRCLTASDSITIVALGL
jgi:hypothetical protein|tara:strand:- start:151 stop:804 length:654 start_codon:yes stop_codon:yes gene_type:complete